MLGYPNRSVHTAAVCMHPSYDITREKREREREDKGVLYISRDYKYLNYLVNVAANTLVLVCVILALL